MVKIRYAELPAGLHVATEKRDGCTIIYLQPGLTPEQRKAALTLARRSARLGHGPSLPAIDMVLAVAADRTRTTARTAGRAMRKHPLLMLPVLALIAGLIVAILVSVVPVGASQRRPTDPDSASLNPPSGGYSRHPAGRPSANTTPTPTPKPKPGPLSQGAAS
ncbi:MAG: hypothetical protein J2P28_11075 [Actinobacteria bacterium]|nr:hypothetical protein [Actinomycetota bacterium]MBO0836046.1 hypothetical protein [Actinomycetota bacterium]